MEHKLSSASSVGEVRRATNHGGKVSKGGPGSKEKMSIKVLLSKSGLQEYYSMFEQSGYQMLDANSSLTDLQAEQILADVERQCGRRFPPDLRNRLWKALRSLWFRVAAHEAPYIDRSKVPLLQLPPCDRKTNDQTIKFAELDPDRQRQVVRKNIQVHSSVSGPYREVLQFEVYRRQQDIWYEYKDLDRCVNEWQKMNPQTMLREDPREEALKLRIRGIIDRCKIDLHERYEMFAMHRLTLRILLVIQVICAILAALMFTVAYMRFKNTPRQILMHFVFGCNQFVAGIAYVIALAFAWAVTQRRRTDPLLLRLRRLIISCERLVEQLSDFRVESEHLRMTKTEVPKPSELLPPRPAMRKQRELKKRHRKKKQKDPMMFLWAPQLVKKKDNMETISKALPQTYNALAEDLSPRFRHRKGDRMWQFVDRLGNRLAEVDEDVLVTRVIGKEAVLPRCGPEFQLSQLPDDQGAAQLNDQLPQAIEPWSSTVPEVPELLELPESQSVPELPELLEPPNPEERRAPRSCTSFPDLLRSVASGAGASALAAGPSRDRAAPYLAGGRGLEPPSHAAAGQGAHGPSRGRSGGVSSMPSRRPSRRESRGHGSP